MWDKYFCHLLRIIPCTWLQCSHIWQLCVLKHAAVGVAVTVAPPLRRVATLTRRHNIIPSYIRLRFRLWRVLRWLQGNNECVLLNLELYFFKQLKLMSPLKLYSLRLELEFYTLKRLRTSPGLPWLPWFHTGQSVLRRAVHTVVLGHGDKFFFQYLDIQLSVTFHQCSILVLVLTL